MYTNISFEQGELVKWYESYPDLMTARDAGLGIILEKQKYSFSDNEYSFSDNEYSFSDNELSYTNYKVFRNKHLDTMYFDAHDLEKIKQEK